MNVTFYNFSKRKNSTAQPAGGTSYTCVLKEGASSSRPEIMIKWNGSTSPVSYNYAHIAAFNRYYWVNNWTYENRCWTASLSVDVLATYKTAIGSSSKYVLRSASSYDPEIADTIYPAKLKKSAGSAAPAGTGFNWATSLDGGTIIIGIIGMNSGVAYNVGGVSYYAVTPTNYMQFLSDMYTQSISLVNGESYGTTIGEAIKALSKNLLRSVTNPTQYIKSVMWFPFAFSTSTGVNPIVGGITSTAVFKPLIDPIKSETVSFSLTEETSDYWKQLPPYKQTTAYLPPYGTFPLDMRKLAKANGLVCKIKTDAVSGLSHLLLYSTATGQVNNPTYANTICQVGVPLNFSGVNTGNTSFGTIASAAAGFATGDLLTAAAGITSAIGASAPTVESRSSYGGISGDIADKYVETVKYDPVDEDNTEQGRPLCQVVTISSLSGYVKCADGEITCSANEIEHSELESFLTGGFFYE